MSEFLSSGHLPRVSQKSHLLASDGDDNEVEPGTVHKSPGIYLMVKKNPEFI